MDSEAFVPLGLEPGGRRSHELLYLPDDGAWFTIVRDLSNLEIITFLPADYHNTCGWMISEDALISARESGEAFPNHDSHDEKKTSLVFSVIIEIEDGHTKSISLGKHAVNPCRVPQELKYASELREEILGRVLEKQIQREAIRGLAFKRPGAGNPVFLPAEDWIESVS